MAGESSQGRRRSIHDPIVLLDEDLLGRRNLARAILQRLCAPDVSVLGIYGGWGTGKTSVLNLMHELNKTRIDGNEDGMIYVEIIDAWKYEALGSLLIPIIVHLRELAGGDLPEAWRVITRRVLTTTALTLVDVGFAKLTGLRLKDVGETYRETEKRDTEHDPVEILREWEEWSDDTRNTERAFEAIISTILQQKGYSRVVLCIDNLDRCSPENAISLLESVKNFLTVPGCAWVFAIDPEVVASYIYRKYEGIAVDGNSYLDKIIPEQYHLSVPSSEQQGSDVDEFLREITRELSFAPKLDWGRFAHIPKIWRPRRLIKCARSLLTVCQAAGEPRNWEMAFGLIMLYHTWPDFYETLSFGVESHVGGVLANFLSEGVAWPKFKKITIKERFSTDPDLKHFIDKAFLSQYEDRPEQLIRDLIICTDDLRQAGLP